MKEARKGTEPDARGAGPDDRFDRLALADETKGLRRTGMDLPVAKKVRLRLGKVLSRTKKVLLEAKKALLEARKVLLEAKKALLETKKALLETKKVLPDAKKVLPGTRNVLLETTKVLLETRKVLPDIKKVLPDIKKVLPGTKEVLLDTRKALPGIKKALSRGRTPRRDDIARHPELEADQAGDSKDQPTNKKPRPADSGQRHVGQDHDHGPAAAPSTGTIGPR